MRWNRFVGEECLRLSGSRNQSVPATRPGCVQSGRWTLPEAWPRWSRLLRPWRSSWTERKVRCASCEVREVEIAKLVRDNSERIQSAPMPSPPAAGPDVRFAKAFSAWIDHVSHDVEHAKAVIQAVSLGDAARRHKHPLQREGGPSPAPH